MATLHDLYSMLPHPLLSTLIEACLIYAVIVAIWDYWQAKKPIWLQATLKMPIIQVERKSKPVVSKRLLIVLLVCISFIAGIGFGEQIIAGKDSLITIRSNGIVTQNYHETCSDWWQYQHP